MAATLFSVPASHPSIAAMLMLEHKGIEYRRIDFVPPVHRWAVRAVGFRGRTVPALKINGRRVQGSRNISRELDAIQPQPPLFPDDAQRRDTVERVEEWGDEVLQSLVRRIAWAALKRNRSTIRTGLQGARLGLPTAVIAGMATPFVFLSAWLNGATDEAVRSDLSALPGALDRVDGWIREGVLGGAARNAADFQAATSLRALETMDDLRPLIEDRPAARFAHEVVPSFPGHVGPALPPDWLPA